MRLVLNLAMVALLANPAQASWQTLVNSPDRGTGRHEDVWFVDDANGWIVNGSGQIWHTSDSGASWTQQTDTKHYVRSVTFASPTRGWVGHLDAPLDQRMFETFDGGTNWTPVPNLPEDSPEGICAMWAVDEEVIYASGVYNSPAGMLKTTDGGATWNAIDMSAYATNLIDCYFITRDHGFVVGGIGPFGSTIRARVLETTNGGASWIIRHTSSEPGEWCWKISFPSPLVGYASMERGAAGPERILATTDGGVTWIEKPAPDSREQGIGFVTEQMGWLGGGTPTFVTLDGGSTWVEDSFGTKLNRVRVLSSGVAYAVGSRVYRFGGTTDVENSQVAASVRFLPAYPNPSAASMILPFVLPEAADAQIHVYDLQGRLVRDFSASRLDAGDHSLAWDGMDDGGRPVPSGVYLARLTAANRSALARVTVVR